MTFTILSIARSLAEHLAPVLPGVRFYEDPNQQGTRPPCLFLQQRYSYLDHRQAGRQLRRIGLDLTYLVPYNLPDLHRRYLQVAEALDEAMEVFSYSDGTETALVRTYDRQWQMDLDALHYKFELKIWVEQPQSGPAMQQMDYHQEVQRGE